MGAWGIKPFENDDASDWLYQLEQTQDLSVIESTLDTGSSEYIELPEGSNILAASEVLAAMLGAERTDLPQEAQEWVDNHRSFNVTKLKPKAVAAMAAVLSEKSELNELWQETEKYESWKSEVHRLQSIMAG